MKLIPASSPGMEMAHRNIYVRRIVDILLNDYSLLRPTAMFLKRYTSHDEPNFVEKLAALRLLQSRTDFNGVAIVPDQVILLTQALQDLYTQKDKAQINYQRGAIVELLVRKMISRRYNEPGEVCLNNQRFVENYRDITVQEVDVAALSVHRQKAEGYECKVNSGGFKQYDCINLTDLVQAAIERGYRVNVGFVAFENSAVIKIKLEKFQVPGLIKLYGLDTMEDLQMIADLEN
jgi:hypothetical protein